MYGPRIVVPGSWLEPLVVTIMATEDMAQPAEQMVWLLWPSSWLMWRKRETEERRRRHEENEEVGSK